MTGDSNRLFQLESRFERLRLLVTELQKAVNNALQGLRNVQSNLPFGSGTSPGVIYVAVTGSGGIPAASAAPLSGTPGSATGLSVYLISGGTYTLVTSTATIYNPYLSATASAVKVLTVCPNGDGTYTLVGESCT